MVSLVPVWNRDLGPAFNRFFVAGEKVEFQVDHVAGHQGVRPGQDIATVDGGLLQALEVDRGAHAGFGELPALVVNLDAPDLGGGLAGIDHDDVPDVDPARNQGAGDHRAKPLHAKDAVHGQPEKPSAASLGNPLAQGVELIEKLRDAVAGNR
jgi:hypothetical protein